MLYAEIAHVIGAIDEEAHKSKESAENTKLGQMLYSPSSLNKAFKKEFAKQGEWTAVKVDAEYSVAHYEAGYQPEPMNKGAYREMDFVKYRLGVEVQLGKYAFMVYNVCAKMTIFKNLGHIDAGVEIVPMKAFARQMSTGVSCFEQFVWDLEQRGVSNIDIPVLILGIAADWESAVAQTLPEELVSVSDRVIRTDLSARELATRETGQGQSPGGSATRAISQEHLPPA